MAINAFTRIWRLVFGEPEMTLRKNASHPQTDATHESLPNPEEKLFMHAFMFAATNPFRGIVYNSWVKLQKLIAEKAPAEEIKDAQDSLKYYWDRWVETASAQVIKGRAMYYAESGAQADSINTETAAPVSE